MKTQSKSVMDFQNQAIQTVDQSKIKGGSCSGDSIIFKNTGVSFKGVGVIDQL